jgi:hypothetical protein
MLEMRSRKLDCVLKESDIKGVNCYCLDSSYSSLIEVERSSETDGDSLSVLESGSEGFNKRV